MITSQYKRDIRDTVKCMFGESAKCGFRNRNGKHYLTIESDSHLEHSKVLKLRDCILDDASVTSKGYTNVTFRLNPDW